MNLDDVSHLSAYLDDELDPAARLAVEWSIESSPPLADQLRSIAQAREVVTQLDRPTIPRDLAPTVVARIASDHRNPRLRPRAARVAAVISGLVGISAVAASLIFALIKLNESLHPSPERPLVASNDAEPVLTPRHHSIPASSDLVSNPNPAPSPTALFENHPSSKPEIDPPIVVKSSSPDPLVPSRELAQRDDRRVVDGILGRSHVRRILIVTDVIGAPETVRNLIAQEGRGTPEFGRISIRQEIVIDPDHAEAAEIFAVPIDERGRRSFVDRLRREFPNLIEEGKSNPELVTQLTEVGQVAVYRGLRAAPLGDPPADLPEYIANRQGEGDPVVIEANQGSIRPNLVDRPAPTRPVEVAHQSDGPRPEIPDSEFVGPPDLDRKAPPKPGERVTLLVWVTRPSRH